MTDLWGDSRLMYLAAMRAAFPMLRPNSFVTITGIVDDGPLVQPSSTPLWTRHMLGVIEAERDRRRYGRR